MTEKTWHLALTGGIGSGKSTVAGLLAGHGAVVVDADAISRQLMEPGSEVLERVVEAFGRDLLDDRGRLDRAALAQTVFVDPEARETLNGIVHPAVRAESRRQVADAQASPEFSGVIVQDIPLLVETGQAASFDGVIVVEAPEEVRVDRLVGARGMSVEDARARIASQATDAQRREAATWVIDNSGSQDETAAQVAELWDRLS